MSDLRLVITPCEDHVSVLDDIPRNFHQQATKCSHVSDSTCKEVALKTKTALRVASHSVFGKAQFGRKLLTSLEEKSKSNILALTAVLTQDQDKESKEIVLDHKGYWNSFVA